jgi:hypothetical protein
MAASGASSAEMQYVRSLFERMKAQDLANEQQRESIRLAEQAARDQRRFAEQQAREQKHIFERMQDEAQHIREQLHPELAAEREISRINELWRRGLLDRADGLLAIQKIEEDLAKITGPAEESAKPIRNASRHTSGIEALAVNSAEAFARMAELAVKQSPISRFSDVEARRDSMHAFIASQQRATDAPLVLRGNEDGGMIVRNPPAMPASEGAREDNKKIVALLERIAWASDQLLQETSDRNFKSDVVILEPANIHTPFG